MGTRIGELGLDSGLMKEEEKLVVELMGEVLPLLKERIKESSIGKGDDGDEISAAVARTPVAYAVVAAYQFRWFVTQVCAYELILRMQTNQVVCEQLDARACFLTSFSKQAGLELLVAWLICNSSARL